MCLMRDFQKVDKINTREVEEIQVWLEARRLKTILK